MFIMHLKLFFAKVTYYLNEVLFWKWCFFFVYCIVVTYTDCLMCMKLRVQPRWRTIHLYQEDSPKNPQCHKATYYCYFVLDYHTTQHESTPHSFYSQFISALTSIAACFVFFAETFQSIFRRHFSLWDISVICLTVVLKLTINDH